VKKTLLAVTLAALGGGAAAQPGYLTQPDVLNVKNSYGECWRTSTWTRDQAAEPCDAVPRAAAPAPVAVEPKREPEPAPVQAKAEPPAPAPVAAPQPAPEKVTLSSDVLFEFGSAKLKDQGKRQLDEVSKRMRNAEEIRIVGHADRIGSEQANQRLSESRADAVKSYLEKDAKGLNIKTAGKGKLEPVTGESCKGMGAEQGANRKLVQCLQPDRRVDIEIFGLRSAIGEPASGSSIGATSNR
jgi:OOP family OmpA-OmpF porin